jgi:hypothetical protein
MKNGPPKNKLCCLGRRAIVLIAALSLCLNTLMPAMATVADTDWAAVICTPDGYKTARLGQDGAPLPAQRRHEDPDCTICHGSVGHFALATMAGAATAPAILSTIRPNKTSTYASTERRGKEARGPPHSA